MRPTYTPAGLLDLASVSDFTDVPIYDPARANPCSTCGSPAHASLAHRTAVEDRDIELDEIDLGGCSYYRSSLGRFVFNPIDGVGRGLCSYGCTEEPACQTNEPETGWASLWIFEDVELPFES